MRLVAAEPGSLVPGGRWGSLIVRAAERAPAAVIEALVRHGASVDAIDDPATAIDGIGALHRAPRRGLARQHRRGRCAAPPRRESTACATRKLQRDAAWLGRLRRPKRRTRDRILEADIDVFDAIACGTPARVTAILDADPAALDRPLGEYGGTPDDAAVTPMAWAIERDKPDMVALLRGAGRPSADA